MQVQLHMEARRFYDGGVPAGADAPAEPPDPDHDPQIVLERLAVEGREQFAMRRRIAYRDREVGELLVPSDPVTFRTDLTSVPSILTWLVPKTGAHLPAALLHDGLVHSADETPTYVSTEGHVVDRVDADRIFRDAMADTGTAVVRRWLVWSAVTTATLLRGGRADWSSAQRLRHRAAVTATLLVVAVLGVLATVDLFDLSAASHLPELPWMGDRAWWLELLGGFSGAVVIPLALGLTWGRFRMAGWVMGIGLALLLHVTAGVVGVTALYRLSERLAIRGPVVAVGVAVALGVGAVVVLVVMVRGAF